VRIVRRVFGSDGLGCLRERHPGWTDGSLEHCLSRDEGGGSPTSVAPRDENGVCMYYAPVKPSAHIGVMQLSKIHPKNDKQPHPIESPNGTKSQGGVYSQAGHCNLPSGPASAG
jgi:hypothetical protein